MIGLSVLCTWGRNLEKYPCLEVRNPWVLRVWIKEVAPSSSAKFKSIGQLLATRRLFACANQMYSRLQMKICFFEVLFYSQVALFQLYLACMYMGTCILCRPCQ